MSASGGAAQTDRVETWMSSKSSTFGNQVFLEVLSTLAAGLVAALGGLWISGLRWMDIQGIWGQADLLVAYASAKSIAQNGWLSVNEYLGFPFVQDWSHFPAASPLSIIEMKGLLAIGASPIATVNLMFLLSFPFIAICTYVSLRYLGALRIVSFPLALAFALLPWHFARLEHLQLANYWIIPLGVVWLAYSVAIPRANTDVTSLSWPSRAFLIALVCGVLVGLSDPYIAVFFLILGGFGFVFRLSRSVFRQHLLRRTIALAAPLLTFGLQLVITKSLADGPSVGVGFVRPLFNQLYYGGYWFSLFIDQSTSPLSALFPNSALRTFLLEHADMESNASYNLALAFASVVCVLVILASLFSAGKIWRDSGTFEAVKIWSALWLVSVACFVMTGFGVVFGVMVTTQIRAWGRMSIVTGGIAVVILALVLTTLWNRTSFARHKRSRLFGKLAISSFLVVLLLDAFGRPSPIPVDTSTVPDLAMMISRAEKDLPDDCSVMNLPLTGFPEGGGAGEMGVYDAVLPYLASDGWRFSFGMVQNQVGAEWRKKLAEDPRILVEQVRSLGFCALLLDADGFTDSGKLKLTLDQELGMPVAAAANRWFVYDLGDSPTNSRSNALLGPQILFGSGFVVEVDPANQPSARRIAKSSASIFVTNPIDEKIQTTARLILDASACTRPVAVSLAGAPGFLRKLEVPAGNRLAFAQQFEIDGMSAQVIEIESQPTACHLADGNKTGVEVSELSVD
jgi:hypothetical protein